MVPGLFCFLMLTQPACSKPQLPTVCPQECGIDGSRVYCPAQSPGSCSWHGCLWLCSPVSFLPALATGRAHLLPCSSWEDALVSHKGSQGGGGVDQGRKRKAFCKLTLHDNCPVRKDRGVTTCCLCTHCICLGFSPSSARSSFTPSVCCSQSWAVLPIFLHLSRPTPIWQLMCISF